MTTRSSGSSRRGPRSTATGSRPPRTSSRSRSGSPASTWTTSSTSGSRCRRSRPPGDGTLGAMRWLAPLTLIVAVGAVALYFATRSGGDPARDAFVGYTAAWSRGDDRAAARLTDDPRTALAQLQASRKGLDGASVRATVDAVSEKDDAA